MILRTAILATSLLALTACDKPADAPIAAVLPLLAEGRTDAVPVVEGARIFGIVTRTDLIAALAHHTLTAADRP